MGGRKEYMGRNKWEGGIRTQERVTTNLNSASGTTTIVETDEDPQRSQGNCNETKRTLYWLETF